MNAEKIAFIHSKLSTNSAANEYRQAAQYLIDIGKELEQLAEIKKLMPSWLSLVSMWPRHVWPIPQCVPIVIAEIESFLKPEFDRVEALRSIQIMSDKELQELLKK